MESTPSFEASAVHIISALVTMINSVLGFKRINYSVPGYSDVFSCFIFTIFQVFFFPPSEDLRRGQVLLHVNCRVTVTHY